MKSRSILVTGGTTGIGLATAKLLAADGSRVIVTGRNLKTLEAARHELPPDAVFIRSDSSAATDAQSLGSEVKKYIESLDGVFFNAGIAQMGPIEATTPSGFDQVFAVNARGPYFQLQSLLPLLANPSVVVFNASVVAELGLPMMAVYSASKAALISLARTLAVELAPRGIRINTVSPGPIRTPIYEKMGMPPGGLKELEDRLASQTLFKRLGIADEIARLVRFLLSDESSYVVGENVVADGGVRLT